ncbi:MAG: glycosyltransferase family 4 protein [Fusobacteriaceae bacterium]
MEKKIKKKFVHICEEFEYTWVGKDNGMIPIYVAESGEFDSEIITCDFKNDLPDEIQSVKIIKIKRFLKKIRNFAPGIIFIKRLPLYWYLIINAKNIDVLMLFHITKCSFWNAFFYKKFNPNGMIYVKADFNLEVYKKELETIEKKTRNLGEFFRKKRMKKEYGKRKKLVTLCDFISYENLEGYNFMKESYACISTKGKTFYLPNGFDNKFIDNNFVKKNFDEKENIFLTVGRLGTKSKNTELILETLSQVDLKNWKFILIGSIEKEFEKEIEKFYKNFSDKKEKVIFTGIIKDRKKLYEYYNRSKVFILPSRWESFGIVMVEALAFGNYVITSNTCAAPDITNNNTIGKILSELDSKNLKKEINKIITEEVNLKEKYFKNLEYSINFQYENLIKNLLKRLG